ncbi:MAG: choice-of-anchor D domain-containing protein [Alphaproteobacteria bacterium]|nr:choice-of-anchor D domain-containing protein [Alphaproteobacteria bacterium]
MTTFILGALFLGGCSETTISSVKPDLDPPAPNIVVTPPILEFAQLMSNEEETRTFTVRNVGETALTVDRITVELSDAFTVLNPDGFLLDPGTAQDIQVVFTPRGVENVGQAVVWSDDPDEPESLVDLIGYGSVPELRISPDPYDFGTHFVPCGDWTTLTLENVGGDLLVIDSIDHISNGEFVLDDPNVFPVELLPGQFTSVNVEFTAVSAGAFNGELQVMSNDPRGLVTATQTGAGNYAATGTESFTIPSDPPVDILFAVDQSCSMDDDSALLGSNFNAFISQIDAVTQGWQIGVANVENGCFNNGILSATSMGYQAAFASAVTEGDDPTGYDTWSEQLYTLVDVALAKTAPGQCNSGFLRPGALLHVILVSDEPEQSANAWAYYHNNFLNYVSDPSLLKVSVIVDESGCGLGAAGYPQSANQTGGVILDMCSNWSTQIGQLGAASLQGINSFELAQTADPASLVVTVDGVQQGGGYSFNPATNEVVFDYALPEGAVVGVDYGVAVACQ